MTIVLDGTTGISTPPVAVLGSTSGSITLAAPAVAGSNTQTLVAATGTLAPLISGTAVTASGTSVDFTSIPSWVKRVTVMFSGVSTNGTSNLQIQLGTSGGVQTTGYLSEADQAGTGANSTTGLILTRSLPAAGINQGIAQLALLDAVTGTFVCSGTLTRSDAASGSFFSGSKTLSGTLDRIRITTVNGTDVFDAGTINILWE
jgi:hypothetical protein